MSNTTYPIYDEDFDSEVDRVTSTTPTNTPVNLGHTNGSRRTLNSVVYRVDRSENRYNLDQDEDWDRDENAATASERAAGTTPPYRLPSPRLVTQYRSAVATIIINWYDHHKFWCDPSLLFQQRQAEVVELYRDLTWVDIDYIRGRMMMRAIDCRAEDRAISRFVNAIELARDFHDSFWVSNLNRRGFFITSNDHMLNRVIAPSI
jgi:hypothetical protein